MLPSYVLQNLWIVDLVLLREFLIRPSIRRTKRNRLLAYPVFVALLMYPLLARSDHTYSLPSWWTVMHYFMATAAFQFSLIIFNWLFHPTIELVKKWNAAAPSSALPPPAKDKEKEKEQRRALSLSEAYADLCTCRLPGEWEWNEATAPGVDASRRAALWRARLMKVVWKWIALMVICRAPIPKFELLRVSTIEWSNYQWWYAHAWCYGFGVCAFLLMDIASELGLWCWSYFGGVEIRPLFGSPLASISLRDLWSSQWHPGIKATYKTFAFRPVFGFVLRWITPNNKTVCAIAGSIAVFTLSGIFHEFCYWAVYGVVPWLNLWFFTSQGVLMLVQEMALKLIPSRGGVRSIISVVSTHLIALYASKWFVLPYIDGQWHLLGFGALGIPIPF